MAITTKFLTGFEHGVASINGVGLLDQLSGATVVAGAARNGSYGLRCSPAGAAQWAMKWLDATYPQIVERVAVKVSTRPAAGASQMILELLTGTTTIVAVNVDSTGQLSIVGTNTVTGPTIDTTGSHVVELQINTTAGTCAWKVDGVAQTSGTITTSAGCNRVRCGHTGTATMTVDYDDWIFGTWTAAGTDWYGDGKVEGLRAGSDGTHSPTPPSSFSTGDSGTAYASNPTTTANLQLKANPWSATRSTTVNVRQLAIATAAYMEFLCAATAEVSGSANAVQAEMAYSSTGTTTNSAGCIVRNSGAAVGVLFGDLPVAQGGGGGALADWSESSNFFKSVIVTAPVAGWTPSEVNSVRFRYGGSGDVTPFPTLQAIMVEVDWPVSSAANLARTAADTSVSSDAATRVLALPRTAADTSASSDSATRIDRLPRSTADTSTSSDSAVRAAQAFARTAADTSLSSDGATRVEAQARSASDTSTSSDSATAVKGAARTASDTSLSSDTAIRAALSFTRTSADTSTSSDAATRVLRLPRTSADASTSSDAAIATKGYARSASDTTLSSDTATRAALSFTRTTADASTSADSATRVLRLPRSTADTSTSSDAAQRAIAPARSTGDTSLSSDASVRGALHFIRSGADTSLSSDSAASTGPAGPPAPLITPPTTATILAYAAKATIAPYASKAGLIAYTSTSTLRAYTSTAAIAPYAAAPAIVAYTAKATLVTYTSTARLGPTYG